MPTFDLADIQAAADEKYGPTVINLADGPVELTAVIRLPKAKRDKLKNLDQKDEAGDIDIEAKLAEIVKIACKPQDAKRLLAAVGDDIAVLTEIVTTWTQASQPGEASTSAS